MWENVSRRAAAERREPSKKRMGDKKRDGRIRDNGNTFILILQGRPGG